MNQEEKRYIRENHKLPFSFLIFSRLFVLIVPLTIVVYFSASKILKVGISNSETQSFFLSVMLIVGALFLILFIIHRIESERKFKTLVLSECRLSSFKTSLEKLNWVIIYERRDEVLQFLIKKSWFSWGEIVTIMKGQGDKVLVNTQPLGRQPFTFFSEKTNFKKIEQALDKEQQIC